MVKGFLGIIGIILGVLFIGWLCTTSLVRMLAAFYTNTISYFKRKAGPKGGASSEDTPDTQTQSEGNDQPRSMKFTHGFCEICGKEFIETDGSAEPLLRQVQLKVDENGKPVSRVICPDCLGKIQDLFDGKTSAADNH